MERVDGIEPTIPLWKRGVLPLNYTRDNRDSALPTVRLGQACVNHDCSLGVFTDSERKWYCELGVGSFG